VNFDGEKCTDPSGIMYGKDIQNPMEDINCDAYIDKWFAFSMAEG
jgi:hypothetical protein